MLVGPPGKSAEINCVDRACFHGGSENRGKVTETIPFTFFGSVGSSRPPQLAQLLLRPPSVPITYPAHPQRLHAITLQAIAQPSSLCQGYQTCIWRTDGKRRARGERHCRRRRCTSYVVGAGARPTPTTTTCAATWNVNRRTAPPLSDSSIAFLSLTTRTEQIAQWLRLSFSSSTRSWPHLSWPSWRSRQRTPPPPTTCRSTCRRSWARS